MNEKLVAQYNRQFSSVGRTLSSVQRVQGEILEKLNSLDRRLQKLEEAYELVMTDIDTEWLEAESND